LVERERALIDAATGRANEAAARLDARSVERSLTGLALTEGQRQAVLAVISSGHGVDVIEALAGTGKTHTAGVLADLYRKAGYEVLGVASPAVPHANSLNRPASPPARSTAACSRLNAASRSPSERC